MRTDSGIERRAWFGRALRAVARAAPAAFALMLALVTAPDARAVTLSPGDVVVADQSAFGGGVIRVDPPTGAHETVSSGGLFRDPIVVAVEADRDILVADITALGGKGGVIRVDPATGAQTTVSSGGSFREPIGVAVVPPNRSPVAGDDAYSTAEDAPLAVAAPGVLANDSDPDGDALGAVRVSGPAHGTLTLNTDGSFRYVPAAGYNGPDSFGYRVSDGSADSSAATVTLTVIRRRRRRRRRSRRRRRRTR